MLERIGKAALLFILGVFLTLPIVAVVFSELELRGPLFDYLALAIIVGLPLTLTVLGLRRTARAPVGTSATRSETTSRAEDVARCDPTSTPPQRPGCQAGCAIFLLLYAATLAVMFGARKDAVTEPRVDLPIIVLTPGENPSAHLVPLQQLPEFTSRHPIYSYLVPAGTEERVRSELDRQMRREQEAGYVDTVRSCSFEVERLAPDRQRIEVRHHRDGHDSLLGLTVWYEATDRQVFPTSYRYQVFNAAMLVLAGVIAAVAAVVVRALLYVARMGANAVGQRHA